MSDTWPSPLDLHQQERKAAREHEEARERWYASLPHLPVWNLIPMSRGSRLAHMRIPWECCWHGTIRFATCAECHREHAEYRETGTWQPPLTEWSVSAGGYRLVIEGGVMLGLAYDEDPWPWGAPGYLVSHLVADAEIRSVTGRPHCCDGVCVCPRHGTPMIYAPARDDHACQDVACPFGHGIRAAVGAVPAPAGPGATAPGP